jgi:hypothetical protein
MKKTAQIARNHKKPWKNEKTVEKLEVVPLIGPALLRLQSLHAAGPCAAGPKQVRAARTCITSISDGDYRKSGQLNHMQLTLNRLACIPRLDPIPSSPL